MAATTARSKAADGQKGYAKGKRSSKKTTVSSQKKKKVRSSKAAPNGPSYKQVSAASLPWRRTAGAKYDFGDLGDGGMLDLEEIDGVDVVYDETAQGGKTISFKIREDLLEEGRQLAGNDTDDVFGQDEDEEWTGFSAGAEDDVEATAEEAMDLEQDTPVASTSKATVAAAAPRKEQQQVPDIDFEVPFDDTLLPTFAHLPLLPSLKRALHSMGFAKPTEIQDKALTEVLATSPTAASGEGGDVLSRDIVGVAETGSGKTLAYSLPILQEILQTSAKQQGRRSLSALILCPTRELALQVRQHVGDVVYRASTPPSQLSRGGASEEDKKEKHIPRVNIVTICGGMSAQKQKRLLNASYGVDIIVATPGRLWEMIQDEDEALAKAIKGIKFLVLDEADRMIENGHFAELENIVSLTRRDPKQTKAKGKSTNSGDAAFEDDFANAEDSLEATPVREDIKTYVFSATMSKELQKNLKRKGKAKKHLRDEELGKLGALGDLIEKLDFRDEDPLVVDLTREGGLVASIQEIKVDCLLTEKDAYLYYFLLRYPGRTLVFLSAIDGIRRLQPLLALLELDVAVLHSGMQQRARLKALDRFKSAESMVLLATDVAARGLDIPSMDHVVHYQPPRTADTYIHRSGRTGRAGKEGIVLQLCCPEEKPMQRALMKSLNKDISKVPELDVEWSILTKMKERVELARQIEVAQHRAAKASHDEAWLRKAAEDMEVDLDEGGDSDGGRGATKLRSKAAKGKEKELRARLKGMLSQTVMLRGISAKYLGAGGSSSFANQMLKGSNHKTMLGLPSSRAVDDVRR